MNRNQVNGENIVKEWDMNMISNYDIHFEENLNNDWQLSSDELEHLELCKADEYCDELGLEL